MKLTLHLLVLIAAVVAFAIGWVKPGWRGFDWQSGGLAFVAASLVV